MNANIITAASLAPPDEIIAPSGPHTLGSNDGERIATEGWVLHQLDGNIFLYMYLDKALIYCSAFKRQLFDELNVQFGNFLRQSAGSYPSSENPILLGGGEYSFDKEVHCVMYL